MTQNTLHAPVLQSRVLLVAGLVGLAAALTGEATYAWQSATASQALLLGDVTVPVDAVIKTAISLAAGASVAFGAIVAAHLWRTGRKGLRKQAYLAITMTLVALLVSVGNLSGYFAWTRGQHSAEVARASESYRVADERRDANAYLSNADEAILRRAEAPADAERELGDTGKALFAHLLIAGMFAAYRLPNKQQSKRRGKRRPKDIREKLRVA